MSEIRANTISNAAGTGPVTLTGQYAAKAWINFNGQGTVAIRESGNVSSITDNAEGDYTVNFSTAMPDNEFAAVASSMNWETNQVDSYTGISFMNDGSYTTTTVRFRCIRWRFDRQEFKDPSVISLVVTR